jgi:hypothetical protein
MRRERLVFVRTLEVVRPAGRRFRVAVWARVRTAAAAAADPRPGGLWSASERTLFAAVLGRGR